MSAVNTFLIRLDGCALAGLTVPAGAGLTEQEARLVARRWLPGDRDWPGAHIEAAAR